MTSLLVLLAFSQAPVLILFSYVYARDKGSKEPLSLLFRTFLLGIVICFPAAILEPMLGGAAMSKHHVNGVSLLVSVFFGVALVEEGLKYLVLRFYAYPKPTFDEPYDGIMYSVAASLGFAAIENLGYVAQFGIGIAIFRMFTAVPMHATTGILMGYEVGRAKFTADPVMAKRLRRRGLWTAVLVHGLYDYLIFLQSPVLVLLAFVVLWREWRVAKQLIHESSGQTPLQALTHPAPRPRPTSGARPGKLRWATVPLWINLLTSLVCALSLLEVLGEPTKYGGTHHDELVGAVVLFAFSALLFAFLIHGLKRGGRISWMLTLGVFLLYLVSPAFLIGIAGLYGLLNASSRSFFWGHT